MKSKISIKITVESISQRPSGPRLNNRLYIGPGEQHPHRVWVSNLSDKTRKENELTEAERIRIIEKDRDQYRKWLGQRQA